MGQWQVRTEQDAEEDVRATEIDIIRATEIDIVNVGFSSCISIRTL